MKYLNQLTSKILLITLISIISFISCKKDEIKTPATTSLTIGNFIVGGNQAQLGSNTVLINNNNIRQMALMAGENNLYVYPIGDSAHPYYVQNKFITQDREVYSLFLCGVPGTTEGIVIKENLSYYTDSVAGIRFMNLSPNSTPLNITLSTSTTVNEVSNLAYKQFTEFKTYAGKYNSAYVFQVRKADGTLLTSFAFSASTLPRFANVTLVIRGQMTGGPAIGVTRVNHDR